MTKIDKEPFEAGAAVDHMDWRLREIRYNERNANPALARGDEATIGPAGSGRYPTADFAHRYLDVGNDNSPLGRAQDLC